MQLWPACVWDELEREFAELRLYLVEKRMNALVEEVFEELERRYRQDQPRAPRGTPGGRGGEWVDDPNSARQRRLALPGSGQRNDVSEPNADRIRTSLAAVLVTQRVGVGGASLIRHCIYMDMLGRQRTREMDAAEICPPTIPAAPWNGPL